MVEDVWKDDFINKSKKLPRIILRSYFRPFQVFFTSSRNNLVCLIQKHKEADSTYKPPLRHFRSGNSYNYNTAHPQERRQLHNLLPQRIHFLTRENLFVTLFAIKAHFTPETRINVDETVVRGINVLFPP